MELPSTEPPMSSRSLSQNTFPKKLKMLLFLIDYHIWSLDKGTSYARWQLFFLFCVFTVVLNFAPHKFSANRNVDFVSRKYSEYLSLSLLQARKRALPIVWLSHEWPRNGPSYSYDRHTNGPETGRLVYMIVTRTARKRARDTSVYRALLTSVEANYKVSTYLSGLQQWRDDIFIYSLYILVYFSQAFFM